MQRKAMFGTFALGLVACWRHTSAAMPDAQRLRQLVRSVRGIRWAAVRRDLARAFGPLETTHVDVAVPDLAPQLQGLRIAHISDLHWMGWKPVHDQLRAALRRERPDLVVISGDVTHKAHQVDFGLAAVASLLAGVTPPLGTVAALGNHDSLRLIERGRQNSWQHVIWLDNDVIMRCGGQLAILGQRGQQGNIMHIDPMIAASQQPGVFRLLISHYPAGIARARSSRVHLVLSGHTHGGQVRLPGYGPIITHDKLPRQFAAGLFRVDHSWLYVSRGIGYSGPMRIRICCPPELPILRLRKGPTPPARLGFIDD